MACSRILGVSMEGHAYAQEAKAWQPVTVLRATRSISRASCDCDSGRGRLYEIRHMRTL